MHDSNMLHPNTRARVYDLMQGWPLTRVRTQVVREFQGVPPNIYKNATYGPIIIVWGGACILDSQHAVAQIKEGYRGKEEIEADIFW